MPALEIEFQIVKMPGVHLAVDSGRFERLADFVLQTEKRSGAWQVALVLTTDAHLRELHRDYMGLDSETDVMTFPIESTSEGTIQGGDVIVSVDRARDQAPEFGHTLEQEIEFLAVHGLLHLCGWDDPEPDARARMLGRQTELIRDFSRAETDRLENGGERPRQ